MAPVYAQALQAMPHAPDVILEASGCAHTVRIGVPAGAKDRDTRALASALAKRWTHAASPPSAHAAAANGQANSGAAAAGRAANGRDAAVPASAEVLAAEKAAEEVRECFGLGHRALCMPFQPMRGFRMMSGSSAVPGLCMPSFLTQRAAAQAARLAAEYAESARQREADLVEANSKTVLPAIGTFQRAERPQRPNAGQGAPAPPRTAPHPPRTPLSEEHSHDAWPPWRGLCCG